MPTPIALRPGHNHSLTNVIAYEVRQTIRAGRVLWHGDEAGGCGYNVHTFVGGDQYAAALQAAKELRVTDRSYAVVDFVYGGCGCTSA